MEFARAASGGATAREALTAAVGEARERMGATPPKLAIVFVESSYGDLDDVGAIEASLRALGDVPVVGGVSAGSVLSDSCEGGHVRGASVVLVGGDDLEVFHRAAAVSSSTLLEIVPAAAEIAAAGIEAGARGLPFVTTLTFGPCLAVDGEALVAAARKGVGARAQLAGCLTGSSSTEPGRIFVGRSLTCGHVTLTGLFSRKPVGISARHGWTALGPPRVVTRTEGVLLVALDGRPALDVWAEDARAAGAVLPRDRDELASYLTHHFPLGVPDDPSKESGESDTLVVRAPYRIEDDGSIRLSGSIAEDTVARIVGARGDSLRSAAADAAREAREHVGGAVAGALVLECASRRVALGEGFGAELGEIRRRVGAPTAGACVYGEIARNVRDVNAFFNTTAVVCAFPA